MVDQDVAISMIARSLVRNVQKAWPGPHHRIIVRHLVAECTSCQLRRA
jgi:hypothetical protein